MALFRVEVDVNSGERKEIAQKAYRLGDEVVVVDSGEQPPKGFEEFDPHAESEE